MSEKVVNKDFEGFKIVDNILVGKERKLKKDDQQLGEIILEAWDKQPNHVSQIDVDSGAQTTNTEMKFATIRLALWLRKQGIGKNDIIAVCTPNHLDSYIPIVSSIFVGAAFNPWHHEVARHFMQLVQPKIMFACESALEILIEAAKLENVDSKFVVFGSFSNLPSVRGIINQESNEEALKFRPTKIGNPSEDLGLILFSSGTTGLPKGVMHSHESVLAHVMSFSFAPNKSGGRNLCYSSLYWITGTFCTLQCIITNSTRIMHAEFDPEETCRVIEKYELTWYFATPGMITTFIKSKSLRNYKLASLLKVNTGGSKINKEIFDDFIKQLSHVEIYKLYGTTETGGAASVQNNQRKSTESSGFVIPNFKIKIIDIENGQTLGPNREGEVCIKTKHLMLGYLKNPQATAESIDKNGWVFTGDKACFTDDGELVIIDRLKEIMKFRGHHVSPTEIEELLMSHPGILEAAVVGVPNLIDGDHAMAFVKKAPNSEVTEDQLIKLSSELGNFKKLWGGVKFIEKLPRTATGKISKGELREMAKNYAKG